MKSAVDHILQSLDMKRKDINHYNKLFNEGSEKCKELDLNEFQLPRQRKPPKRFSGPAASFQHQTVEQYFLVEYYKLIDTASSKLNDNVNQEGAVDFQSLEACLLSGDVNVNDACQKLISAFFASSLKCFVSNSPLILSTRQQMFCEAKYQKSENCFHRLKSFSEYFSSFQLPLVKLRGLSAVYVVWRLGYEVHFHKNV